MNKYIEWLPFREFMWSDVNKCYLALNQKHQPSLFRSEMIDKHLSNLNCPEIPLSIVIDHILRFKFDLFEIWDSSADWFQIDWKKHYGLSRVEEYTNTTNITLHRNGNVEWLSCKLPLEWSWENWNEMTF